MTPRFLSLKKKKKTWVDTYPLTEARTERSSSFGWDGRSIDDPLSIRMLVFIIWTPLIHCASSLKCFLYIVLFVSRSEVFFISI